MSRHADGPAALLAPVPKVVLFFLSAQLPVDDGGRRWVEAFIDWWNGPGFFARLPEPQKRGYDQTFASSFRQASAVATATITTERLAKIAVPTLLLTGVTSPAAARESAALAAASLRDGRVDVVAGAGHMGPLTHSAAVNERVLAFFADVRRVILRSP